MLLVLLENGKMNFQEIVNECIPNRNRCHETLLRLTNERLIRYEPRDWRRGQPKKFSLTKKGKQKAAKLAISSVNRGLTIVEHLIAELDAAKIKEEIDSKISSHWRLMVNDEYPFKGKSFSEKVQNFIDKQALPTRPIFETFKRLHKILTHFRRGEVDFSKYITIVKGDGSDALTIPLNLLKGLDFAKLFFLSHVNNLQEMEIEWKPKTNDSLPKGATDSI